MKPKHKRILIASTLAVLLGLTYLLETLSKNNILEAEQKSNSEMASEVKIGGPFTLTNQRGEKVSDKDFQGKLMLVYFGFTYCPDICPTGLKTIGDTLMLLGRNAENIAPVFITIDPERDTVEQLASYMPSFHPSIQGLTGTPQEIKAVLGEYKVYAQKVEKPDMSNYMMDHSAYMYLMGTDGNYITHFRHGATAAEIAQEIKKHL